MSNENTQKVLKNLSANSFNVYFVENSEVARGAILDMIAENAVVGVGDSATVRQIGILGDIETGKLKLIFQLLINQNGAKLQFLRAKYLQHLRQQNQKHQFFL